jgi:hypothetical protein
VAARRRVSHAAASIDILAATPLISATSLAAASVSPSRVPSGCWTALVGSGVVVEATRRSKWRLFGLKGTAPLGEAVRPPYRPEPGRGRGWTPILAVDDDVAGLPLPLPPLTPIERRSFDYADLQHCMEQLDLVLRQTRRWLDALARRHGRTQACPTSRWTRAARLLP